MRMEKAVGDFHLPKLPYSVQAFGEFLSRESFEYHYEKHHQAYLDELNQLVRGTPHESKTLEEVMLATFGIEPKLFNQAAQSWNHAFFWHSMTPEAKRPGGRLAKLVEDSFGTVAQLGAEWVEAGVERFGSGWVWLVVNEDDKLSIVSSSNADNPMFQLLKPLACADVWEHAYYIDHRNDRKRFLTQWLSHLDWDFAEANLERPEFPDMGRFMRGMGG